MLWVLLDLAVVLLAIAVLAAVGLGLYRRVRRLGKAVSAASDLVSTSLPGSVQRPDVR